MGFSIGPDDQFGKELVGEAVKVLSVKLCVRTRLEVIFCSGRQSSASKERTDVDLPYLLTCSRTSDMASHTARFEFNS